MNSQQLINAVGGAKVVAMCGISGSGKTTLARIFESRGYRRLSVDLIIWEQYPGGVTHLPVDGQMAVFARCNALLESRLADLIDAGVRVVVDSTMCKRAKRDRLRAICRDRGIDPAIIWLNEPLDVLRERLVSRRGSGPDDQIVPDERLESFWQGFERPTADESVIAP